MSDVQVEHVQLATCKLVKERWVEFLDFNVAAALYISIGNRKENVLQFANAVL